jgi:hypothetical protein
MEDNLKTSGTIQDPSASQELVRPKQYSLGDVMSATEPIQGDGAYGDSDGTVGPEVPGSDLLPVTTGSPQELLKRLFDEEYKAVVLEEDDALRVAKSIHSLRRGGSAGQRLICAGDNCEFREGCELWKTKVGPSVSTRDPQTGQVTCQQATAAPEGKSCPLEEIIVQDARTRYATEFADIMTEKDPKVVEGYINDLCQIEMMVWRCNMVMSFDYANPLIQTAGAVTSDGRVIWTPAANPILEIQERLQQRKTRILNDLVKTPREKYKKEHAVGNQGDDSLGRAQAARKAQLKEITGKSLPDQMELPAHVKEAETDKKGSDGK